MNFDRFVGKKILLAEGDEFARDLRIKGKEQYGVDFVVDWKPFERPGLAKYMQEHGILAGVIHPDPVHEKLILSAHHDGAKLLILYSFATDSERNQMFDRLMGRGLNMMNRPHIFPPKVLLEAVGNMLDWTKS